MPRGTLAKVVGEEVKDRAGAQVTEMGLIGCVKNFEFYSE